MSYACTATIDDVSWAIRFNMNNVIKSLVSAVLNRQIDNIVTMYDFKRLVSAVLNCQIDNIVTMYGFKSLHILRPIPW
jgi:hypothetical protein